ncbi:MAG: hypothetical protein ACLQOO_10815, partial [Terriglobia bacterium]
RFVLAERRSAAAVESGSKLPHSKAKLGHYPCGRVSRIGVRFHTRLTHAGDPVEDLSTRDLPGNRWPLRPAISKGGRPVDESVGREGQLGEAAARLRAPLRFAAAQRLLAAKESLLLPFSEILARRFPATSPSSPALGVEAVGGAEVPWMDARA